MLDNLNRSRNLSIMQESRNIHLVIDDFIALKNDYYIISKVRLSYIELNSLTPTVILSGGILKIFSIGEMHHMENIKIFDQNGFLIFQNDYVTEVNLGSKNGIFLYEIKCNGTGMDYYTYAKFQIF